MWKGGIRHSVEGRGGSGWRVRSQWVVPIGEVVNTGAAEGRGRQSRPVRGAKCLVLGAKEEFEIPYSGRSRVGVCNRAGERVVRSDDSEGSRADRRSVSAEAKPSRRRRSQCARAALPRSGREVRLVTLRSHDKAITTPKWYNTADEDLRDIRSARAGGGA